MVVVRVGGERYPKMGWVQKEGLRKTQKRGVFHFVLFYLLLPVPGDNETKRTGFADKLGWDLEDLRDFRQDI